jgi:HlyD family secretion protein
MKKWMWILIAAIVLIAVVVGVVLVTRRQAQSQLGALQTQAAAMGTLSASVGATGTLEARQSASLGFALSGRVGTVSVELGDTVAEDDILASLDPTSLPQQVVAAQADLVSAQKALDDLLESDVPRANAQLALANAQKSFDQIKTTYERIVVEPETGGLLNAQDWLAKASARYNYLRMRPEASVGYQVLLHQAYLEYIHALQAVQKAQGAVDDPLTAGGRASQATIDTVTGQYEVAKAQLEEAQRNYARLKDGPNPEDVAAAQSRVDAIQATLNQARIKAPFTGTISGLSILPGDLVSPGTVLINMADLSQLHVDVPIAEVDINRIQVGQAASLTFDAVPEATYVGRVTSVGLAPRVSAGAVTYPVTVVLDAPDELIRPGMTVAVMIEVSRLENVLLVPNRAVRSIEGSRVVYVMQAGIPVPVKVELGASNDVLSEVRGGDLKDGDLVVLNPPSLLFSGNGGGPRFMGGGGG